eukprot:9487570-Prorocentrum_lima.AAC.1
MAAKASQLQKKQAWTEHLLDLFYQDTEGVEGEPAKEKMKKTTGPAGSWRLVAANYMVALDH